MSIKQLVDIRLDPRTATGNYVELTETYTVKKIEELVDAYGFALSETPLKRTGAIPTISQISYVNDKGETVNLTEQVIGNQNLLVNQFMCNYGTTLTEPKINRNYRIGQIFTSSMLLGKQVSITYKAIGSTVNTDVLYNAINDTIQETVYNSLMPIGFVYVQYPFSASPVTMYPKLAWQKLTVLRPELKGVFFRTEEGGAIGFQGGVQEQSLAGHEHYLNTAGGGRMGIDDTLKQGQIWLTTSEGKQISNKVTVNLIK